MLRGLRELGCEVTLLSSTLSSETQWSRSSIDALRETSVNAVLVYERTAADRAYLAFLRRFQQSWLYRSWWKDPPVASAIHTPPGMRRWFRRAFEKTSPDIVFMNYVFWDRLVSDQMRRASITVIDALDLVTITWGRWAALERAFTGVSIAPDQIEDGVLNENYVAGLAIPRQHEEYRIYDRYAFTIAITAAMAARIEENAHRTEVLTIPVTHEVRYVPNSYSGAALFVTGPNPFNLQGYLYFAKKVLPRVRERLPSFSLEMTGPVCSRVAPEDGVRCIGFVPGLADAYATCRFAVCPVLTTTGQQIKIVEAMAHGVPVIAARGGAEGSPIRHGENGFVAETAEEFVEYVVLLWNDRALCQKLGAAARETIREGFSAVRLVEGLAPIVTSAAALTTNRSQSPRT
jgi:glycosyltransferase involved in cell wall biosynthesis